MRVNPRYNNTCSIRIGMYREQACYDCRKLSECDQHYNEETKEWDYRDTLSFHQAKPKLIPHKLRKNPPKGPHNPSRILECHRSYLVKIGKASKIPIRTTLEEALVKAGLRA